MEGILDFDSPLDVNLLDRVVGCLFNPSSRAEDHPDAWSRVDSILQYSQSDDTKVLACTILENVIRYKWRLLPVSQQVGIRDFVVGLIMSLSASHQVLVSQRAYVTRLNVALVEILKHEWPDNWPEFISELCTSSQKSESVCANNMAILRVLSEEVFDHSKEEMVSAKAEHLKTQLETEFSQIYELCEFVLTQATSIELIRTTLKTLNKFLSWIPLGYVFETNLLEMLLTKFFPEPSVMNETLACLSEIACLRMKVNIYDQQFVELYVNFLTGHLPNLVTGSTDIVAAYHAGTSSEKEFIHHLALFFTGYFQHHRHLLESDPQYHGVLVEGHMILTRISAVPDDMIFRLCLEYWQRLARFLYISQKSTSGRPSASGSAGGAASGALVLHEGVRQPSGSSAMVSSNPFAHLATAEEVAAGSQRALYADVLRSVRLVVVMRMAKPEEVLVVEDENGMIVREHQKDTAAMTLYKSMRDTLVFLANLDTGETESILKNKLMLQMNGREWSWSNLNTLCWAIGSISGTFGVEQEKKFLVHVIKDLLLLCEMKRGKDNKAVIASNIMYIVGQYPRFLRSHWKFLRTVVTKLFEFMHEPHPGVQDMACDTFLKIAQRCRRKFVTIQPQEREPFIMPILMKLPSITADLEAQQMHTFYEAVGYMIADQPDAQLREELIRKFFEFPNASWNQAMQQAGAGNDAFLMEQNTMRALTNILKTNIAAARSLRHAYLSQIGVIYLDMLSVYNYYSEAISNFVANYGEAAPRRIEVKLMRAVKKDVLILIQTFVKHCEDPALIVTEFVPPLMEAVLHDYRNNIPGARDAEVLSLMTVMVERLKGAFTESLPDVLAAVFECTLQMITEDYDSHMDIRMNFFRLLRAINEHCFMAYLMVPSDVFKYTVDSMVWAMRHNKIEVGTLGIKSLLELFERIGQSEVSQQFYEAFFFPILKDTFSVLTDTLHSTGFRLQAQLLQTLFHLLETQQITVPLFDTTAFPDYTNQSYAREYLVDLLGTAFPNLTADDMRQFVEQMFSLHNDLHAFKVALRDFLVSLRQYSAANPELLAAQHEAAAEAQAAGQEMVPLYIDQAAPNASGVMIDPMKQYFEEDTQMAIVEADAEQMELSMAVPGLLQPYHPVAQEADMQLALVEDTSGPGDLIDPENVPSSLQIVESMGMEVPSTSEMGGMMPELSSALAIVQNQSEERAMRAQSMGEPAPRGPQGNSGVPSQALVTTGPSGPEVFSMDADHSSSMALQLYADNEEESYAME